MIPAISNNFQTYRNYNQHFGNKTLGSRQVLEKMLIGIPEALQAEAREMAIANTVYRGKNSELIYKFQNFRDLVLDVGKYGRDYTNRIALKLDLLAKYDPEIYIGGRLHPVNWLNDIKGYEHFRIKTFESDINKKLETIATGKVGSNKGARKNPRMYQF